MQQVLLIDGSFLSCLGISEIQLNRFRPREKAAVYGIDDGLGGDLSTTEKSSVQAFDGVLASLHAVKLQVNVTLGIRI